jgi:hypothetical protein
MAHGKPVTIETETEEPVNEHFQEKLSEIGRTEWEKFCTREHAQQAREDVEEILRALHAAAGLDDQTDPFYSGFRFHKAELRFPKDHTSLSRPERAIAGHRSSRGVGPRRLREKLVSI